MSSIQTPTPSSPPGVKARKFQDRVDYVAKALKRGSWGRRFEACFEEHDGPHVIAVVMRRAERNEELRKGIMAAFEVDAWPDVPWHKDAKPFADLSPREIGLAAERAREARAAGLEMAMMGGLPTARASNTAGDDAS